MTRRMFDWDESPAHSQAVTVDVALLAAETERELMAQGFEVHPDSRWKLRLNVTMIPEHEPLEGEPGTVTLGRFHDWRTSVCPVCSLPDGFHDRLMHDAITVPRQYVRSTSVAVVLSNQTIEALRDQAAIRRAERGGA